MTVLSREEDFTAYNEHLAQLRSSCIDDLGHIAMSSLTLDIFTPSTPESRVSPQISARMAERAVLHAMYSPPIEQPPISVLGYAQQYDLAA